MNKFFLVLVMLWTQMTFATDVSGVDSKQIFAKLQSLNQTREALASSIDAKSEVTEETFRNVCQPVGKELQRWSQEKQLKSRQISHKNRNEKHAVPNDLKEAYDEFQKKSSLMQKVTPYTLEGVKGEVHLYRIQVLQSCMSCHGKKSARPAFIKEKYVNDRAFDFKSGDLRGVYMVFKPLSK